MQKRAEILHENAIKLRTRAETLRRETEELAQNLRAKIEKLRNSKGADNGAELHKESRIKSD